MRRISIITTIALLIPVLADAHHEAIFGPLSPIGLTSDAYLTAQLFSRRTGPESDRVQETTTVLGAGFSPFKQPLSIAVIVPFSVLTSEGTARTGLENAIVAARYRIDLPSVASALSGEESFVMAMGGVELPTGTLDHQFGRGALASVVGGLMSVEVGHFSAIGYGFFHRPEAYHADREGAKLFLGGGAAWTPIDEPTGRLMSLQLGLSREAKFREQIDGVTVPDSGGWGVYIHPTLAYGWSKNLMIFGQTSLPLHQNWRDVHDRERFRVGAGLILAIRR